ncbi:(-)-5-epieremophilene synthase stps3 [Orobanche gracilis]
MALNSNSFFHRPDAKFSPSLWGDHFINYISDSEAIKKNSKTVEALKNDVIRSLVTSSAEGKMIDTMNLIDTLERLGLSHHFQNEIQQKLQQVFNLNTDYEAYDLYTVALHFRLFRQHGHPISSEIFGKWMDVDGKFKDS